MHTLGIYPYSEQARSVEYGHLLRDCALEAVVSPTSWGYAGERVGAGPNRIGWTVEADLEKAAERIDTLLIPAIYASEHVRANILSKVRAAIPRLQRVYYDGSLREAVVDQLQDVCASSCCVLQQPAPYDFTQTQAPLDGQDRALQKIPVPVIVVAGMWEETDKFTASLALRDRLLRDGYRLTQIGSRSYCELFGFHSFPQWMFDSSIDERDKVYYFNRFVHQLLLQEAADVLLLTIPGAIHGFNQQFTNGFGLLAFEVFQALTVDYLLLCTFYDKTPEEFMDALAVSCTYRFGHRVNGFHMSNLFIDAIASAEKGVVLTRDVPRAMAAEDVRRKYAARMPPLFDVLERESADALYRHIIQTLSADVPTVAI